jgi:hypothetical protein
MSNAIAITATLTINIANFRLLHFGMNSSGEISSVRFIPCGVISKAYAMNNASTNPAPMIVTNTFITQPGALKVGNRIDPARMGSHAIIV